MEQRVCNKQPVDLFCLHSYFMVFVCFYVTGGQFQGIVQATQVLYHWIISSALYYLYVFVYIIIASIVHNPCIM